MDFNPLICIASNPWDGGAGGWGRMLIYHSSLLNLPSRSQRQVCLTYKKPKLSGMQLSWQSKEMENHYKLKICYLISMSYFFSQEMHYFSQRICAWPVRQVSFSITAQTLLLRIKPEKRNLALWSTREILFSVVSGK